MVRYYEKIATRKRGSCTRSEDAAWACQLEIDDGDEFAISLKFKVGANLNYIGDSMQCSYAG